MRSFYGVAKLQQQRANPARSSFYHSESIIFGQSNTLVEVKRGGRGQGGSTTIYIYIRNNNLQQQQQSLSRTKVHNFREENIPRQGDHPPTGIS